MKRIFETASAECDEVKSYLRVAYLKRA